MAVVIGSNLRKELAAGVLFDGVSFKVERRQRLALSGPNGAGKTTLLRMLSGETGVDGGQLVFDKGTRVALHDQRPPRELGLSLREYAFAGARDLVELEEVWEDAPGLPGWLSTIDHKRIAKRYFVTAIAFLLVGLSLAEPRPLRDALVIQRVQAWVGIALSLIAAAVVYIHVARHGPR